MNIASASGALSPGEWNVAQWLDLMSGWPPQETTSWSLKKDPGNPGAHCSWAWFGRWPGRRRHKVTGETNRGVILLRPAVRTLQIQPGQVTSALSPPLQRWRKPLVWADKRELFHAGHEGGWHSVFVGNLVSDTFTSEMTHFSCSSSQLEPGECSPSSTALGLWSSVYGAQKAPLL